MKRRMTTLLSALLIALLLTGCGGGGKGYDGAAESAPSTPYGNESWKSDLTGFSGGAFDMEAPSAMPEEEMAVEDAAAENGTGGVDVTQPQKIIRTAQLELETMEFEQAAASLEKLAEDLGGFIESGSVGDRGSGYKWGDYTVRVPAERFDSFLNRAGELCHETWRNVERQNISESYYDTAGRLKTQQIKLERLQALLSEAKEMADIITIESAIAETEWMIEDLSGTLRRYDAQVDYSTIHVSLQEVYRLSNVEEAPLSFGGRLGAAFTDGLRAFGESMEDLAVSLAYSWLWLVLWAGLAVLVFCFLRKRVHFRPFRRRKGKTDSISVEENGDDKSEDP